jgi:hypothetical protein
MAVARMSEATPGGSEHVEGAAPDFALLNPSDTLDIRTQLIAVCYLDLVGRGVKMVQPLAYAHVGFYDSKGNAYTLIESDTPSSKTYYLIPQQYRASRGSNGKPDIAVSLCSDLRVPTAVITGFLEPYIPSFVIDEIKKKFGDDIILAPLPMYSAGRMLVTAANMETWAITVDDRIDQYDDVPAGIPEEIAGRLKLAAYKWKKFGIRPAIYQMWDNPDNGMGAVYPSIVGTNVGAKVPISILARGADNVTVLSDQIKKGAAVVGQIAYNYRGTIRPYYLKINANISKIHEYFSANLTGRAWFATADIYQAVEELKHKELISVEIYDEDHKLTTKYNVQQILDKVLQLILTAAFDSDPKVQAEKQSAVAKDGGRWWWWSGGFAYRGSHAHYERIFNFELKISGISEPIPVTVGLKLDTPDTAPGCNRAFSDQIEQMLMSEREMSNKVFAPLVAAPDELRHWLSADRWATSTLSLSDQ